MRLRITTPAKTVIDDTEVLKIHVEVTESGFDILPGQARFVTCLAVSTVTWTLDDWRVKHCALLRAVISVTEGQDVAVSGREAVPGEDLPVLRETVLPYFFADVELAQAGSNQTNRAPRSSAAR
jgi:alternate F1F0 ATPase F1 subunit epsilon